MERQSIKALLERYMSGETDLKEEARLRDYFRHTEAIPEELKIYKNLFQFFENEQQVTYDKEVLLPKKRSYKWLYTVVGMAAVVVLLLTVQPFQGTSSPQAASESRGTLKNTKGLFMLMGGALQESKTNLHYMQHLKTLNLSREASADSLFINQPKNRKNTKK